MPQGQQRRNNARGQIPTQTLPRLDMLWEFVSAADPFVIISAPGYGELIGNGHTLVAGIDTYGQFAIATSVTGDQITLTFPIVPITPFTLTIAGNDEAVRNSSGGFLQAGPKLVNPWPILPYYALITANTGPVATVMQNNTASALVMQITNPFNQAEEFFIIQSGAGGTTDMLPPSGISMGIAVTGDVWWISNDPVTGLTATKLMP